jgi:hypothetical protein
MGDGWGMLKSRGKGHVARGLHGDLKHDLVVIHKGRGLLPTIPGLLELQQTSFGKELHVIEGVLDVPFQFFCQLIDRLGMFLLDGPEDPQALFGQHLSHGIDAVKGPMRVRLKT